MTVSHPFVERTLTELANPLSSVERGIADGIGTLVMPLGPYRNLTTLLGAIFALHPQAMVLNHAGRVFGVPGVDFSAGPDEPTFRRFIAAAVRVAQGGERGRYGGTVLKSHAFDDEDLRQLYKARYGSEVLKPGAKLLFWKESMRLQLHIQHQTGGFKALTTRLPQVKFVLPVRHPVHCAKSNIQTGHSKLLAPDMPDDLPAVLGWILDNLRWIATDPLFNDGNRLLIWENDLNEASMMRLARFCGLEEDAEWARNVEACVKIKDRPIEADEAALYRKLVAEKFSDLPGAATRLLAFVEPV